MDTNKNEISSPSNNLNRRSLPPTLADDEYIFLRICVPDLNIRKCFQFCKNQKVSEIKEQCITSLPLELKQSFNYGLFCPPTGTKCGKFLDEEKLLDEYPFSDYAGYLELRFKQRIYKSSKIDEKQFKSINTRTNLRRLLEYVINGQVEKVTKMCAKGLDPNFHCVETGETPLTLAASTSAKPGKMIMALVNGGAFMDFRNLSGSTSLHRAVESNNLEALITLLELGSSPNYKDSRGLTALYLSIIRKADVLISERLLREKANIGAQDMQGWHEVHQACRYGLVQHLEHLLFYGADMNAKNASGNTPLHVCAVNGQETCARVLLQKGASTDALNYANQTPYQVAVIAGNLELASVIQGYRTTTVDLEKTTVSDCSDVISNNSSGIGTANSSDFTEASFPLKNNNNNNNDGSNSSNSAATLEDNFSPSMCKSRSSVCCENSTNESLILPVYRSSSKPTKERTTETNNKYYATAPRQRNNKLTSEPRTVVLHKTKRGFGFVLRGAKATSSSLMDVKTSGLCPALQYLDDVDRGSVADLAGLRKGDYLLAINGEDVSSASHGQVVDLIRNSGKLVTMTVVSRPPHHPNFSSLSYSKYNDWQTSTAPTSYATLPNKFKKNTSSSTSGGTVAPLPPRRDPKTTLSVGEIKARSMYSKINSWDSEDSRQQSADKENHQPKTASIRSRPISSRITTAELEELFQRQAELSPVIPDTAAKSSKRRPPKLQQQKTELRRNFYSVPDLVQITINNNNEADDDDDDTTAVSLLRNHKSQDNVNEQDNSVGDESSSTSSQMSNNNNNTLNVRMKNNNNNNNNNENNIYGHCANNNSNSKTVGVNSSFNPNNQAIIYASPSEITNPKDVLVTYATLNNRNHVRKSASLHAHSSLKGGGGGGVARIPIINHPAAGSSYHTVRYHGVHHHHSMRNSCAAVLCLSPPPSIPEPDYSQSDDETEQSKKVVFKTSTLPLPGNRKGGTSKITLRTAAAAAAAAAADNFNSQNIDVEEIRKARARLRTSISFPVNYTVVMANAANEDGDNSSSGVSSDQEPTLVNEPKSLQSSNKISVVSYSSGKLPTTTTTTTISMTTTVNGNSNCKDRRPLVMLPPPDFVENVSPAAIEVLEPPPQFSDNGNL